MIIPLSSLSKHERPGYDLVNQKLSLLTGDADGKKSALVLLPQGLNDLHEGIQVFGGEQNRGQRNHSRKP